jgi:hypothetical protein
MFMSGCIFDEETSFSSIRYYIFSFRKHNFHVFASSPCMKLVYVRARKKIFSGGYG